MTIVDRTRPSPGTVAGTALPCRILRTDVRMPRPRRGALPLVVVADGADGDPSALRLLLDAWARAGYVVAAPKFPPTEKGAGGGALPASSADQAHDLSLVLTDLLARAARPTGALAGRIDPHHVGAAGMSFGGLAVYGLISNSCCRDDRITAAVLLAAVRRQFPDEHYEENRAPVLLIQGDADGGYHNSLEAYPELKPPKWFVTLHGSHHSPPFEVPPGPMAPLVARVSTAFWNRYLRGDAAATNAIVQAVRATDGRATLRRATTTAPAHPGA